MYKAINKIEVFIWGSRVGAVMLAPQQGYYVFEYDPKFIASKIELAPIMMPLSRQPYIFTNLPDLTYKRLPALLADALPDDFGNALINSWMNRHGIEDKNITALDRLAYMGKRGLGALEFKPDTSLPHKNSTAIKLSDIVESARIVVNGQATSDNMAEAALMQLIAVGTSAGGARAKAVIAWNPQTKEIRSGQFDIPEGFEHWLLKFDGLTKDNDDKSKLGNTKNYGRIEYAYYKIACKAGISMNPCSLMEENGRNHFMTKRFDRDGNTKHHMQTLCAMAHLDYKQKATHDYSQLFITMNRLNLDYNAKEEAFRRMVFNVVAANNDDHTKNISFLLEKNSDWKLAPAYDMTHACNSQNKWINQHLTSVNGKFKDITLSDLMQVADRFGIGTAKAVIEQVNDAVLQWPSIAKDIGIDNNTINFVQKNHVFVQKTAVVLSTSLPYFSPAEKQELTSFTNTIQHYYPEANPENLHQLCIIASDMKKLTNQNASGTLSDVKYNTLTDQQENRIKDLVKDLPGVKLYVSYKTDEPAIRLQIPPNLINQYIPISYTVPEIPKNKFNIPPESKTAPDLISKKR